MAAPTTEKPIATAPNADTSAGIRTLTGAEIIWDALVRQGVEVVFDHRPIGSGECFAIGRDESLPDSISVRLGLRIERIHALIATELVGQILKIARFDVELIGRFVIRKIVSVHVGSAVTRSAGSDCVETVG